MPFAIVIAITGSGCATSLSIAFCTTYNIVLLLFSLCETPAFSVRKQYQSYLGIECLLIFFAVNLNLLRASDGLLKGLCIS